MQKGELAMRLSDLAQAHGVMSAPVDLGALKPTNPKDQAATDRLDLSLFPDTAVAYGALAFTEGHLKYGGYNWRDAGVLSSIYVAALRRHVAKWWNGEEEDPTTGVPHLASALACIAVLIDAVECDKLVDDRPPRVVAVGAFFSEMRDKVRALQKMHLNGPKRHTQEGAT